MAAFELFGQHYSTTTKADARAAGGGAVKPLVSRYAEVDKINRDGSITTMTRIVYMKSEADAVIRELEAERDAARADAEKYRWLRTATQLGGETLAVFVIDEASEITNKGEWLADDDLDARIDAARRKG